MAPLIQALAADVRFDSALCVTAQHRQMLDQVLQLFAIEADFDLNIMQAGQNLTAITTAILNGIKTALEQSKPDLVLVHGDTCTTFAVLLVVKSLIHLVVDDIQRIFESDRIS